MTTSNSNKILVFFVMTFLLSLMTNEIQQFYKLAQKFHFAQIIPGLVAVLLIIYYELPGTFGGYFKRRIIPSVKPTQLQILITLFPLIIVPISYFLYKLIYNPDIQITEIDISYLIWPFIGVFFEELGWRGYLQHKAGGFIHMFLATLLTGFMWFFWQTNAYMSDIFYGVIFLVLILSFSYILAYLYYTSNNNIILCYIFHLTNNVLLAILIKGYFADLSFLFVITILYLVLALAILILNPKLFQLNTNDEL